YKGGGTASVEQVKERVREQVSEEQELLVAPEFFVAVGREWGASGVQVSPKRGRAVNELTKYRYDAVVEVGGESGSVLPGVWLEWEEDGLSVGELRRLLGEGPSALGGRRVPDARGVTGGGAGAPPPAGGGGAARAPPRGGPA